MNEIPVEKAVEVFAKNMNRIRTQLDNLSRDNYNIATAEKGKPETRAQFIVACMARSTAYQLAALHLEAILEDSNKVEVFFEIAMREAGFIKEEESNA